MSATCSAFHCPISLVSGKQSLGLSFLKTDDLDAFEEACYFTEHPSCGLLTVELKLCTFVRSCPSGVSPFRCPYQEDLVATCALIGNANIDHLAE